MTEESTFDYWQGLEIFIFSEVSRSIIGSTRAAGRVDTCPMGAPGREAMLAVCI